MSSASTSTVLVPELEMLRAAIRELMTERFTARPGAGGSEPWQCGWAALNDLGAWSTLDPPDGSLAAATVVAEELGRALYAGPVAEILTAAYVLAVAGEPVPIGGAAPAAVFAGRITGEQIVTPDRASIVLAATEGGELFAAPFTGAGREAVTSIDVSRSFTMIRIDPATATALPGSARAATAVRRMLYCADTVGAIGLVLDRTIEYAGQRRTFGAPIGKYQAVAHRLVDHSVTLRQLRLLLRSACVAFDTNASDFERRVAILEAFCFDRAADLLSDCIQLSGAIGFTWEYGHHFALRRVVQNTVLGGGTRSARARLTTEEPW